MFGNIWLGIVVGVAFVLLTSCSRGSTFQAVESEMGAPQTPSATSPRPTDPTTSVPAQPPSSSTNTSPTGPNPPSCQIQLASPPITYGGFARVIFSLQGVVTSATVNGVSVPTQIPLGLPPISGGTYRAMGWASGPGGSNACFFALDMPPPPTASILASASVVIEGDSPSVTWTSTDATSCAVTRDGLEISNLSSGSYTATGITANSNFAISCVNASGSISQSVKISVNHSIISPMIAGHLVDCCTKNGPNICSSADQASAATQACLEYGYGGAVSQTCGETHWGGTTRFLGPIGGAYERCTSCIYNFTSIVCGAP